MVPLESGLRVKMQLVKLILHIKLDCSTGKLAGVNIEEEGILMAPTVAIPKMLERNKLNYDDIDIWEIHEAFASQVLATIIKIEDKKHLQKLGVDFDFGKFPMKKLIPMVVVLQ